MNTLRYWILFSLFPFFALGQQSFSFYNQEIISGTKKHVSIPVTDGKDSTFIPITVFHGVKSGPVLGITAGVHGYEYPPILAAQQLIEEIDPQELTGTIILVQVANVPSFLGRSPFVNPIDKKNLNRSFPGSMNGSLTERIAHTITHEVIVKSNYFVDMHGGDASEDLRPYNAWYHSDALAEASRKGREMAMAMGFDYSVIFNVAEDRLEKPSVYCSQEAFHRNIPSVDIECGRIGIPGKAETNKIVGAMLSLLSHLKMTPISNAEVKKPTIIAKRASLKSNSTGFFYPLKRAGDSISSGELIGYITDFYGNKLKDIKAPNDGMILYMIGTPPVNKGDTILSLGILP